MEQKIDAYWFAASDRLPNRDGRKIVVGKKHSLRGKIVICHNALHGSRDPFDALQYAPGQFLYMVKQWGDVQEHDDKLGSRHRGYIAMRDATNMLQLFARKQALGVGHLWNMPDMVREYLETGDQTKAAEARAAARAVGDAARDAEARAAANAAGDAANAAGDAADAAARAAAYAAAYAADAADAARAAAYAAYDAADAAYAAKAARAAARAAADAAYAAEAARAEAYAADAAAEAVAYAAAREMPRVMFNDLVKELFAS